MLKQVVEHLIGCTKEFTLEGVAEAMGLKRNEVKYRLDRLESEGLIKRIKEVKWHRSAKDPQDGQAPRLITYQKCGDLEKRLAKMTATQRVDTTWDKMWRTIRVMRRFTRPDLMQLVGVTEENSRHFTRILAREGFIRAINPKSNPITWVLVKDPGPQRPRIPYERKANG